MAADLDAYSDDDVMTAIQRRKDGPASADDDNVKPAEFDVMASGKARLGRDDPESVFYMETVEPAIWRTPGEKLLDSIRRVVVIPRLREVVAQSGFTRFDALAPDEDGELGMGVERAALARALTWLPAVEHKGEGIFVQFDAGAIDLWRERAAVKERGVALRAGYDAWRKDRPNTSRDFPGVAYVMMHSLAHMLLTTIALESGYAASSLRERIYGSDGRYGILI